MGSGVFRPPVSVSPSGTPCGEPASRESKAIGVVERRAKYQQARTTSKNRVQRHRAGPALEGRGSPARPELRRRLGIADGDRDLRRRSGRTGDRYARAGTVELDARTRDGLADIAAPRFRSAARAAASTPASGRPGRDASHRETEPSRYPDRHASSLPRADRGLESSNRLRIAKHGGYKGKDVRSRSSAAASSSSIHGQCRARKVDRMRSSMDSHELKQLLDAVRDGRRASATEAARRIRTQPFQDAGGFAKVDLHRASRCGFPEVIFGQGKTAAQIEAILRTLLEPRAGGAGDAGRSRRRPRISGRSSPRASTTRSAGPSGSAARRGGAEAGPGGDRHGGDQRPARRRGGASDGRGLELRGRRWWPTSASRVCTGSCTSFPSSETPTPWWSSPAWRGPCRAWSAAWSIARSSPCRPASATGPISRASRRCWACSTVAPRTSWS